VYRRLFNFRVTAITAMAGMALALSACGENEGSESGGQTDLAFATLDQGSAWYNYGISIGKVLEDDLPGNSLVEVLPYSGSIGNPELVSTGEAELATTFSSVARWAHTGQEGTPYEDEPLDNIRVLVGGIDEYYFGPIASSSASFDSLDQAIEEEMPIDFVSQPRGSLGDAGTKMILEAYGTSEEDITSWGGSFDPTSTNVASDAIQNEQADLWIQAITAGHPNVTELAQATDISILDISDEALENLSDFGLESAILPAGTFQGQDEEVQLPGFYTSVIASEDMDEETAYAITKSIVENADQLKEENAGMEAFDPDKAASETLTGGVPLHPGAEKYFLEEGIID